MDLYESIFMRKSVRAYERGPLDDSVLEEIKTYLSHVPTLISGAQTSFEISSNSHAISTFKAPHYINIYCRDHEYCFENVGFIWQQISLYLTSKGIGSCWLGMSNYLYGDKQEYPFAATIAFGEASTSPYREMDEFRRKALADISIGHDPRLEAVRLAPSAFNAQTWFYVCHGGVVDVYRKEQVKIFRGPFAKMGRLNLGIGLAHLYVASNAFNMSFDFVTQASAPDVHGYIYVGTVCAN